MLEVRLLGQFDVRRGGAPLDIASRPAQSLLAYLLLTAGTAHRREKLAGLLWPDTAEANARKNLRQALWHIRRALGADRPAGREYLLTDDISIAFDASSDYWLDVAVLSRKVAEDWSPDDLIRVVSMYGGDLLPGFYDEWVVLERERLQVAFEHRMKLFLDRLVEARRWEDVLEWGERWIALGHTPEPAYRAVMVAHAGMSDLSKMAATYRRCVEALKNELGVEPSEQTRTLYERLAKGERLPGAPAEAALYPLPTLIVEEEAPASGEPPFMGLRFFDEADADLFFGREQLTAKLVGHLREHHFLAVIVGASGSGKSSIVRAGLIPTLKRGEPLADGTLPPEGSAHWPVHVITPTAHPLEALAASLTHKSESVTATATLMDDLARDPRSLHLYVKKSLTLTPAPLSLPGRGDGGEGRLLLVVDQFEELFTLCHDEAERKAFIDNLMFAATPAPSPSPVGAVPTGEGRGGGDGPTIVVITLRADFYAHCAQYANLREALAKHQEYIGPMSAEELRRAIEEPARRGGWSFEPGLVDLLLREVGDEPGGLPLLSHALLETWQRRRGRMLSLKGYAESGGVRGAIAKTAESVYQRLMPEQQAIARNIFIRLTELGEGTQDTRRRAALSELIPNPQLQPSVESVLKILADARLVTTAEETAEVAHEALIREWPTLRQWLIEDREGLRLHRHLTEAAQAWDELDRDPGELYRGARLSQAAEWAAQHAGELNTLERAFLDASQEWAEREAAEREAQRQRELEAAQRLAEAEKRRAEEQAQAARRLRQRAVFLTGALIIAGILAVVALVFGQQATQNADTARAESERAVAQQATAEAERQRAQNERRLATARELAAAALNNLAIDPERSILLALQAVSTTREVDGTVLPEAEEALHRSIVASPIRLTLKGHETRVLSAAFSPDGKHLATIGNDGTTIVWDAMTGEELLRLPGTTEPSDFVTAQRITYSPDGRLLAACDNDVVKIYDAATGELTQTLSGHQTEVVGVAFSSDGRYLATGSLDNMVRIWDAATGKSLHVLNGHTNGIGGLTFSPDGKWLVTASDDGTLKIWDTATGVLLRDYSDFTGEVDSAAFSPDGTRLAFAAAGGLYVWRLEFDSAEGSTTITNQEILTISEGGFVRFSPDGTQLAAASASAAKLWDARTGRELLSLVGHTDWVMGLAFSPDGKQLASTSLDETVKIWNVAPGQEVVTVTGQGAGYGTRVAYNPDGQEFATNGGDGSATLWNATTGEPRLTLAGHGQEVLSVAFSSDGMRFATGSLDTTAIVWDTASGQKVLTLSGHEVGVRDIAFSPDGARIATGGFDNTARVWDAVTGQQLLKLTGHERLVVGVAFSPDGIRLATSSTDTTAKIWDVKTGALLFTLTGHTESIPDIAYSPDGLKLATGGKDTTVKIRDATTGTELLTLAGHSSEIQSVAFSPDGKFIATGSGDNTAKVWDVATGEEILTLPGNLGGVYGVAFSPLDGGAHLAVASTDGVVRVFLLRIEDLLALAQSRVTRSLTTEECQKYLHVEQCP